jgi:ribosomal protein S25
MSDEYSTEIDLNKTNVITKIKKLDRKYGKVANIETKIRDPFIAPVVEQKIRETAVKSRGFTPTELAQKNDIRISAIKKLLKELEKEGLITCVESSRRLKVYRGTQVKGDETEEPEEVEEEEEEIIEEE